MKIPECNKQYQEWLDKAVGGKSMRPECNGDLKDNWCAFAKVSWLECECGFEHTYENG